MNCKECVSGNIGWFPNDKVWECQECGHEWTENPPSQSAEEHPTLFYKMCEMVVYILDEDARKDREIVELLGVEKPYCFVDETHQSWIDAMCEPCGKYRVAQARLTELEHEYAP